MNERISGPTIRIFLLRVALGVVFALLLSHFFFPTANTVTVILAAGSLVVFAYVFEHIHRGKKQQQ
jgi:hypothetical protein